MDATIWVHQNLIKMGKIFGVDFQGHEEEDSRKPREMEAEVSIKRSRYKGVHEQRILLLMSSSTVQE